jgi:hypothetical protein
VARDPGGYAAQPYEQLRASLERTGDARGARDVAIASERRRRAVRGRAGRAWSRFLDWTVGYGYRPWLAVLWVVGLTVVGAVLFGSVVRSSMVPAGPDGPPLQPVIFTLDMLVPVVDLQQASAWTATGGAQWLALLFTIAGWALTTAVVAAVSAAVRRT